MLLKLDNPIILTKVVEIISEIVTEVRIKINDSGINITALDPANVSMVKFKLPKSVFSEFESKNEVLGINLDSLKQILKRAGSGSTMVLEKKENTLMIEIRDKIKRDFNLSLIDIEKEEKEMPNLEYSSEVELNSKDLVASIEDCAIVSDSCAFIIKENKFFIEAKGLNSAKSEFSGDEAKIKAEDCKSKYSIEYLQKFIKGAKLAEKVVLNFANDHPLKMEFKTDEFELSFILAPRAENEE